MRVMKLKWAGEHDADCKTQMARECAAEGKHTVESVGGGVSRNICVWLTNDEERSESSLATWNEEKARKTVIELIVNDILSQMVDDHGDDGGGIEVRWQRICLSRG